MTARGFVDKTHCVNTFDNLLGKGPADSITIKTKVADPIHKPQVGGSNPGLIDQ